MKNRKSNPVLYGSANDELPVGGSTTTTTTSTATIRHGQKKSSSHPPPSPQLLAQRLCRFPMVLVLLFFSVIGVVLFRFTVVTPHNGARENHSHGSGSSSIRNNNNNNMRLLHRPKPGPLDEFATLSAQLESHDIVAVLFAASWCPMSTPITQLLDHLFREKLLSNNNNHNNNKNNVPNDAAADRHDFAVLYVSSDKDEESFTNYIQPGWQAVPYTSLERTRVKQHFRVCARREMEELEIETREGELPTVLILDGHRQQVLTRNGIQDMRELGQDALDHWKQLQRALDDDTTTGKNE